MRKRFLLSLLVALLTSLSTHAYDFQSGDLYYNITSDTTVEVTYQKKWSSTNYQGLTTATIPETVTYNGTTYSVTSIGEYAFGGCFALTSITIGNSVTSIGNYAFDYCSSLTSTTIGNSVTSIGERAFEYCSSLTSITLPNSVTSIGDQAFYNCSSLTKTNYTGDLASWCAISFSRVESNPTFYSHNLYINDVEVKDLVTFPETVISIGGYAFSGCTSITSLNIPNSVTSIGDNAFYNCSSITSITLPNSVTSIGKYAFCGCSSLISVTIGNSVTCISDFAFLGCSALISITIPNSVTSIGCQAFYNCSALISITLPNSVTKIGDSAFSSCKSLTSITIPNSVTSIGDNAFEDCSSLTSISLPNSVTSIGWAAFRECSSLTSLTIPNSVTSIGDYTFEDCSSLTSITIPNSVTSIGRSAFSDCYSLISITIPNSVTSIGDDAFDYCSSLTSITIPNSVTSIGSSAFSDCSSLTSITLPNSVTSIGEYAFWSCSSLTSITIPNSVTSIRNYAFYGCFSLTSITIPNSVTSIGDWAFSSCKSLTSITIPNSVTSIGNSAFRSCSSLTSLTIPNSVTSIGDYAFDYCSSLTSTTIGNSVTSIGRNAFYGCTSLTSVTLPNSVTSIGESAFYNCSSLTSITIPNSVTSIGESAFYEVPNIVYSGTATGSPWGARSVNGYVEGYLVYADETKKTLLACSAAATGEVTLPNSVTSIGSYAFRNCSSLTSITLPNSVTSIGESAFYECSSLTSITLPNSVTSIGERAFWRCSSLTSITIPKSVTSIGNGAFYGCSSLTSITLPNSVTCIGERAFYWCSSLTSITLPNSVTSIGESAFYGCTSLTSVTIPNSVTSIGYDAFYNVPNIVYSGTATGSPWGARSVNGYVEGYLVYADETKKTLLACSAAATGEVTLPNSVTSIGESAFYECSSLTSITLPNSVTSIGDYAFYDCTSLTSIILPNSVTSIGDGAFEYCSSLTSLTIPNSVTSIGDSAFEDCSALTSIILPNSVTSIGNYAFYNCSSLTSITIGNSVTSIGRKAFYGCTSLTSVTLPNSVTSIGESAFYEVPNIVYSGTATGSPWGARSVNGYVEGYLVYADETKTTLLVCSAAATGEVTLPNSVTSIGSYAFSRCSSLTSITLSNSVTSIGSYAFSRCSSLTSVTSLSCTPPSCRSNVFNYTPSEKTLVVPSNSLASYKSASPWKDFTSFEKCLSIFVQSSDSVLGSAQIDQEVDCDSVAIISATVNRLGYHFTQWSDGNADNPRTIKLTQDTNLTAEFAPNQYTLTTIAADAERGTTQGDTIADYLTELQVSAIANYGYHFTQWSDGNTDNPRTIKLTQDTTFTAAFAPNQYTLTTTTNYAERGTTQGDTIADYLTEIQVSATANYGYYFASWSDGNTDNPRTISLTKDTNLVALFDKNQYTITTLCNAEQGNASEPQTAEYLDEVTISATANYGYHFKQWNDGNADNPRTIKLTQDTTFTVEFAPNQYTLTTTTNYAERGTAQGDTIADYLTEIQVSATANYGYHFTQWSDGNTDNPRTFSLTKDTNLVALFEKNQYTITTSCNAEQGTISGKQEAEYLDEVTLNVLPNVGWHFTQWKDGNTDNPRTIKLTQDTAFAAEFAMDYSGKCGDELYWAYSNQEIKITGSGLMYNYTDSTMPWTLLRDSIKTVRVGNNATSIGEYAFANTPKLAKLQIGTGVEDIGANAFAGCNRIYHIYCYPTYPPFADESSFANYNVYLHIPCENKEDYTLDLVWGKFKFIECIGSEDVEVSGNEVTVSPSYEDATFTWPVTDNADTYSLVITKDGVTFCTLVFNAQGQLVSIAFKPRRQNAPAAEGTTPATYAEQTANGFRFTVTGLDEGTAYAYTLTVRNAANTVLETYTGDFTTLSNIPTGINESAGEDGHGHGQVEKLLHNGQVLIIRNGETYDMMGQRL